MSRRCGGWWSGTLVRGVQREGSSNNFRFLFVWPLFGFIFGPVF
ncbi:hypothetical protein F383_29704 [Gossypium arboreum]|uniref:Uncharacterized protein n=1 Tax=Gossypium arboreum TaxID=29729 RepID=A0A0B0PEJ1_GOSAR|nr:hypothetical protein F383_29704 [Gossypium arboreum]